MTAPEQWPSDDELWAGTGAEANRPAPLPLRVADVMKPSPFPTHVLPPAYRNMVKAVAANKQVPEDLPALFGLAAISTLAANRVAVSRGHGWTEPLNVYTAVVMDSGTGKTPAAADVIRPLRQLQKRMRAEHGALVDALIDQKSTERGLAAKSANAANKVEDEIRELEESKKRPPRLMLGSDITVESLAEFMSTNGGAASILDAEGEFFPILSGRYTKQIPNLGLALKAHDGDYYEVRRIGRMQDDIERAILTLAFGVQSEVMHDAAKSKAMVERGLLNRFMFSVPLSLLGLRTEEGAPYDRHAMQVWSDGLECIFLLPVPDPDAEDFPVLTLSAAARKRHVEYCGWIERRLHPDDGDLGDLPGWASKHKGRALRVAGLLHLIAGFSVHEEIGELAMNAAIEIGQWSIGHAVSVFGMAVAPEGGGDQQCLDVMAWVRREHKTQFTAHEARRRVRKKWVTGASMVETLDRLVAMRHLIVRQTLDGSGRKALVFEPHPVVLMEAAA